MLNTSQRLVNKNNLTWWYVFKTSWRCLPDVFARRLEDVLARRLEDVLKTSWRRYGKTSWRCLENVLKTSWRRMDKTNILVLIKTSWRRMIDKNMFVFIKMSWRRLEDVFWRRSRKTSSSRRMFPGFFASIQGKSFTWITGNLRMFLWQNLRKKKKVRFSRKATSVLKENRNLLNTKYNSAIDEFAWKMLPSAPFYFCGRKILE